MAEVIDLVLYRHKQKLLRFLTEGVTLNIDDKMLEEFQWHLECFLSEIYSEYTLINDGENTLEIQELNQTIMFFHFLHNEFTVSLPYGSDVTDPEFIRKIGAVANSGFKFWLVFEDEIPHIQQSFL